MKPTAHQPVGLRAPQLLEKSRRLDNYLKTLSVAQLAKSMHLSPGLAAKTKNLVAAWTDNPAAQSLAIDSFTGDIYSGLRTQTLSRAERDYADTRLRILSGLYGIIRPYDGITPYRLEMGYKLPNPEFANLYKYWGNSIADTLPSDVPILNLSAAEYTKVVMPYVDPGRVITPRFLSINPKTGQPTFVVVHAKIARGAFARWVIKNQVEKSDDLRRFADIGYSFDQKLSTTVEPVYICQKFGGLGLSVRLR